MVTEPAVVGIDASTQSVKAIAWSRDGHPIAEGRAAVSLNQPKPGYAEQDPDDWWSATRTALLGLTSQIDSTGIQGVAISNQRETVALLNEQGDPVGPAITWLDIRVAATYLDFAERVGKDRLHAISGRPVDVIPIVYKLDWLAKNKPELLARARTIVDVHSFCALRLTGEATASYASADAFGLFDIVEKRWSELILEHLGIPLEKFPRAVASGKEIGRVTTKAAAETGLRAGTLVFAGGGDGQCAGLGVNAMRSGTVYLNLGTAVVAGAWSKAPVLSKKWRTILSPTGGFFLEHAQRAGALFLNFVVDKFAGGRQDQHAFDRLEAAAGTIPIGSEGLLVCPYLTGCMDPYWNPNARATITGLCSYHTPAHIYRAALEALTVEAARAIHAMGDIGLELDNLVVVGGGAASPLWLRMIADSVGVATSRSLSNEASCLGAAIIAAVGAGWYPDFAEAATAMTRFAASIVPDPGARDEWDMLSSRQGAVYPATLGLYSS